MRIHGSVRTEPEPRLLAVEAGGPIDFELFFLEQHDRLYRALYFVTGRSSEAEDIAQEAFMRLWERWDRVGELDDPVAYLFRTAMNGFRMRVRHAKVVARHLVTVADSYDPFEEVDLREDARRLLADLTPRQRAAIVLTEVLGYDSEGAADILGVRASTVRVLVHRARGTLRAGGEA